MFGKVQNSLSLPLSFSLKHTNRNESLFHSPLFSLERTLATRLKIAFVQSRTNDLRMIEILLSFVKLPCSARFLHKHRSLALLRAPVGLLTANVESEGISCKCRVYFLVILRREGNFDKPRSPSFNQKEVSVIFSRKPSQVLMTHARTHDILAERVCHSSCYFDQ